MYLRRMCVLSPFMCTGQIVSKPSEEILTYLCNLLGLEIKYFKSILDGEINIQEPSA